jgi:hypothetical protein
MAGGLATFAAAHHMNEMNKAENGQVRGTSSARVDIEGQLGVCDRGGVCVSRSMPVILTGHINELDWEDFCDKLDEALVPMEKVKQINFYVLIGTIAIFVFFFIIMIVALFDFDSSKNYDGWWVFMVVAVAVLMFGTLGSALYTKSETMKARTALRRVCDEGSKSHPGLSFHVKFQVFMWFSGGGKSTNVNSKMYNYIEVQVARQGPDITVGMAPVFVDEPQAQLAAATVPRATAATGGRSPAQRLADLELIKEHLSEEEYKKKRTDIIMDL